MSPLLFVIFFSDVISELEKVQLEAGTVMLGPLASFAILFADDLVLLARTIKDLQQLINAFAKICDESHQQVAVNKIEAMIFHKCDCNDHECKFFVRDGALYQRASKQVFDENDENDIVAEVFEEMELVYKQEVICWSNLFKYLGSFVSSHELLSYLVDCVVGNANKASDAVRSVCRSAVAMPVSRAVGLHKSLVSPIALLNCVAWLPLLEPNSTWYAKQCDQWWFLLRLRPRPSKGYKILTLLNFETWELSGVQQILNFIFQMTQAPRGSFLAALLSELRSECILSPKSWLFGAVRLLSRALAFPRAACLLARVDNMLEHIRESNISSLRDIFREKYLKAIRHAAYDRLAGIPRGPYRKLRVLREWIDGAGRLSSIFDVSQWSSSCLHFISLLMFGELPVHRVRAYYAQRRSLGNFSSFSFL